MNLYYTDVCRYLVVRTDIGHSTPADYKHVATTSCLKLDANKGCPYKGKCVITRDDGTGKPVNRNTKVKRPSQER